PAVLPAPGITITVHDGELWIERPDSPYLGEPVPQRWADGWLRTKDAGSIDPATGLVTILGRLDSQVTIGALPGVVAAIVVLDEAIVAYLQLADGHRVEDVEDELSSRLASYKRPQVWHALPELPRTTTGKLVRDRNVLRTAVQ